MSELTEIVKRYLEPEINVTPESRLKEDFFLDSLSMMAILYDIENELQMRTNYEMLPNAKTVLEFEQCFFKE